MPASAARTVLEEHLGPAIYPHRRPLQITARHLPGEPQPPADAVRGPFLPFEIRQEWGGMWSTTWFRMAALVPDDWAGQEVVALVDLGGQRTVGFSAEGLVYGTDLQVWQGLHHRHREIRLPTENAGNRRADFYVEAAANPIAQWHMADWPLLGPGYDGPPLYVLEQAELAVVDRDVEAVAIDLLVAIQMAEADPSLTQPLDDAVAVIASGAQPGTCRDALATVLSAQTAAHRVHAVGHAHIDTAWLWPVRETRRKCARTFANQLRLMERYPEHRFAASQAVQYDWIRHDHPDLWQQIQNRVSEGRWEPVGSMWVEADTNVPSGESLIRQFLHGHRFFAEHFGTDSDVVWIPDVFGYSAALPQIAAGCGATTLVTQKLSWNDTNRFPHTTFWWEGHDGSRLLAHFPPADTYNGTMSVEELLRDRQNHRDAVRSPHSLYPFGFGDGGGGPTAQMIEQSRRLGGMGVAVGTVSEFRAAAPAEGLATWVGELYLEAHRATPTTHGDVKWGNRRGEEALRAAEIWSVAAGAVNAAELDRLWKLLLLNQFHDILPGSSIHWVYEDAARDHAEVLSGAGSMISQSQSRLAGRGEQPVVFNPSTWARREVVDLPDGPCLVEVPGCGWAAARPVTADLPPVDISGRCMDNGILRVEWDDDGLLVSVWDHEAGREVIAAGSRANLFQLHDDRPRAFDAWDVDREYLDSVRDLTALDSMEVVESRPLRGAVRFIRRFGSSTISQVMRMSAGSRRIDFLTEVDWQERHQFLKVAFPVAVRSTRATYEIQHGHIERPTTANTSWEEAQFEVCAHRWAHLGEPGYGVALINNGKYGHDIRNSVMRLSLLRGPGYPDPEADRGRHRFAYALLPHRGDLRWDGKVVEEAEAFNLPLTVTSGSADKGVVITLDAPGVSVEALKPAEDGDGTVLRLCEVYGAHTVLSARLSIPWSTAERTDMLERPTAPAEVVDGGIRLSMRPFEVVTLRIH